ncbi:c-type cytochrome [Castellaniella defragrans]|nr:c-type cytochrome [Castellaniella defragrans]
MRTTAAALCAAGLLLAACSDPRPDAAALERAEALRPADPALAARYERSCIACHAQAASGAPLTGFAPHWTPRLRAGMDALVDHAEHGYQAMPARGLCQDCTRGDLRALTEFMSQTPSEAS